MRPVTVIVSLPVAEAERSLRFYRDGLHLTDPEIDDKMIAFELPNLSLFLIERSEYAKYTDGAGVPPVGAAVPGACVFSCAIGSREEGDDILRRAEAAGGSIPGPAEEHDGSYTGYFSDPDGHVWELVFNARTEAAAG